MYDYSISYCSSHKKNNVENSIIRNRMSYKVLRNALPEKLATKQNLYVVLEKAINSHAVLRQLVDYEDDQSSVLVHMHVEIYNKCTQNLRHDTM